MTSTGVGTAVFSMALAEIGIRNEFILSRYGNGKT